MFLRLIFGILLSSLAIFIIFFQNITLVMLTVCLLSWGTYLEFLMVTHTFRIKSLRILTAAVPSFIMITEHYLFPNLSINILFSIIFIFYGLGILISLRHHRSEEPHISEILQQRFNFLLVSYSGLFYIYNMFAYLIPLYQKQNGHLWVLTLLTSIFMGDTLAFFFGKYLGAHKIYPLISPNKTYEGSLGGLLGTVSFGFICNAFLFSIEPSLEWFLIYLTLGVLAQASDFLESLLKRGYQIKDSSHLIPGHGGLLDRCDSLTFALPFFYAILVVYFRI